MDILIVAAALGAVGLAVGLGTLVWLRGHPELQRWAPFAMILTVGSAAVLAFGLLPPATLWLMLGAP